MPEPILVILTILAVAIVLCVIGFIDADEYEVYEEQIRDDWGIEDARGKNMFALRQTNTSKARRLNRNRCKNINYWRRYK